MQDGNRKTQNKNKQQQQQQKPTLQHTTWWTWCSSFPPKPGVVIVDCKCMCETKKVESSWWDRMMQVANLIAMFTTSNPLGTHALEVLGNRHAVAIE